MKRLYYIRHGLSETNQQGRWGGHIDTPLVPEGHDQAKAAGQAARDQGLSFDIIVSSPLQRAHHTAQHIATHTGYPHENIVLHDIFKERAYGVMDGQPCDPEIVARHKTSEANIDHIEGVEKLADFQKREPTRLLLICKACRTKPFWSSPTVPSAERSGALSQIRRLIFAAKTTSMPN